MLSLKHLRVSLKHLRVFRIFFNRSSPTKSSNKKNGKP